jgi:hypothetical protein
VKHVEYDSKAYETKPTWKDFVDALKEEYDPNRNCED